MFAQRATKRRLGEAARVVRVDADYAQRCLVGAAAVMQANSPWLAGRWLTIAALKVGQVVALGIVIPRVRSIRPLIIPILAGTRRCW